MKLFAFIIAILLLTSCAQFATITGGEKDTTPPVLITDKTIPQNRSVNFNSKEITLTFDEFFTISNPTKNVIISPTLPHEVDYVTKGKKLFIKLNNTLQPNTTYTINFGDAIKDYNANNVLSNFSYVFSTGSYIDSLSCVGKVLDAFTGQPTPDALVMLYDSIYDSVVAKTLPTYFAKTNKKGEFSLQNLKAGTYKIVSLIDKNNNYKFDLPNEQIAFSNTPLVIDTNTKNKKITLKIFEENYLKQSIKSKKITYPGKVLLALSIPAKNIKVISLSPQTTVLSVVPSVNRDSITVWTNSSENNQFKLTVTLDTLVDTITLYPYKKTADTGLIANEKKLQKNTDETYTVSFNRPLKSWNKHNISLKKDTVTVPIDTLYIDTNNQLVVNFTKAYNTKYNLTLNPNAVTDIYNKQNNDTIKVKLNTYEKDFFGVLGLVLQGMESDKNYIVSIKKGNTIFTKIPYSGTEITINNIPPGVYTVEVLIDENKNGKWDTGDYYLNKQPENSVSLKKQLTIRSNWEVKETFNLNNE